MSIPAYHKPGPRFFCPHCHADTSHYLRANGETAVCLACGDERPVKQLVQALSVNCGGPEKRV